MSKYEPGPCWGVVLAALGLMPACSGDDSNGGPDGSGDPLLSQAPHCPAGQVALRIEGSVDGATVSDLRSTNINVTLRNAASSSFDSPSSNLAPSQPSALEIHLTWAGNVPQGQTSATTGGTLVAPSGAVHVGQELCITRGAIGFVNGGSEDGAFKFEVTELRSGADCLGDVVAADLRGCFEAGE